MPFIFFLYNYANIYNLLFLRKYNANNTTPVLRVSRGWTKPEQTGVLENKKGYKIPPASKRSNLYGKVQGFTYFQCPFHHCNNRLCKSDIKHKIKSSEVQFHLIQSFSETSAEMCSPSVISRG